MTAETEVEDIEPRYCICADPENCREPIPGYICRPKASWYCEMCDRWFRRGGDCQACGYPLRKSEGLR